MRKIFTCWSLFTLLLAGVGFETLSAQDKSEWKTWSEKDANKIIKKATKKGQAGFFRGLGNTLGGATISALGGGNTKVPFMIESVWLTGNVCWALARITQIKERRTDEETISRHDGCREHSLEHYALTVSTSALRIGRFNSGIEKDRVETEKLGQMFLQHKKNEDIFVRAAQVAESSDDGTIIVLFPRSKELVEGQKEVQLEMVQDGSKMTVTFKFKDLIEPGKFEDL